MAKVAIVNDYVEYAEMAALPLREAGHDVYIDISPIDWEALVHFGPQLLVIGLVRDEGAIGRPIEDPVKDIIGYKSLLETEQYPAIQVLPLILAGAGLREIDVPTDISYDLFVSFPKEVSTYAAKVTELATEVRSRRRISGYVCPRPGCGSRLVFLKEPARDLFCPKCGAGVAIIDDEDCTWLDPATGRTQTCKTAELTPRPTR